jgi:hypothetical protein
LVFDIEAAIKYLPEGEKYSIRKTCKEVLEHYTPKNVKYNSESKILKNLKNKDCFYMKSDKSNAIVIMNKDKYFSKVEKMIAEGPYTEILENPLKVKGNKNFQFQLIKTLKECKVLIEEKVRRKLTISNPVLPKLYCLPKIHKTGIPMRPIVSGINSPTYNLSKWLVKEFNLLEPPKGFSIKNSLEFIESIKNEQLDPNEYLISFDVTALFPSIPIVETMAILESWLNENDIPESEIQEYIKLTNLCMKQNAFQFNNKFYIQNFGTSMGNPLSPFLANLFMSHFETQFSTQISNFPRVFKRYVDDIFAIVSYSDNELTMFLDTLNSQFPSIKFTHERESNSTLPFLDILIIRANNKLQFDIYRKPTQVDRFIDNTSFHAKQHKLAAFNSMVYRMLRYPLTQDKQRKETNYIKNIAIKNGFDNKLIDNIIRRQKFSISVHNATQLEQAKEPERWAKLTFFPPLSNRIQSVFKQYKIRIAPYSNSKLKSILGNTKDKTEPLEKSGIYEINCENCDHIYIGQTIRNIETRFKDHCNAFRLNKPDRSAVAKHMMENKHQFSIKNLKLLCPVSNERVIDAVETLYIYKEQKPLMNADKGPLRNSCLFNLFNHIPRHRNTGNSHR